MTSPAFDPAASIQAIVGRARSILRGEDADPAEMLELALRLRWLQYATVARRLFVHARRRPHGPTLSSLLREHQALCTARDASLPRDKRLEMALAALIEGGVDLGSEAAQQSTLLAAGYIHRDIWRRDFQTEDLERALHYFRRAAAYGVESDGGSSAVSAAIVLDILAQLASRQEHCDPAIQALAERRREEARELRLEVRSVLAKDLDPPPPAAPWSFIASCRRYWLLLNHAEALATTGELNAALDCIDQANGILGVTSAMASDQVRRFAMIHRYRPDLLSVEACDSILRHMLPTGHRAHEDVFGSVVDGRVGLGLSGGGFRASLYHIGVLARLAEEGLLRHIDVLSCVSGGSIVGAHYYLELRRLLEEKPDPEITRQDYIDIIDRVRTDFLAGVQQNVRVRTVSSPVDVLRIALAQKVSRTDRAGELFERHIYSRVPGHQGGEAFRSMASLRIRPRGEPESFDPEHHNWTRSNKVPTLIINATTLNTGHSWQFTTGYMGEPPSILNSEIDANERLRRVRFEDLPSGFRNVGLGRAVGASACVPGVFAPVVLDDLFPGRVVQLVDGGVYDNQGVAALLDRECDVLIVSDASGQMDSLPTPDSGLIGVTSRTNEILMARVREAQYRELASRVRSAQLQGLLFMHLRRNLEVFPVNWTGCEDPIAVESGHGVGESMGGLTDYGIRQDIQRLLSGLRTDLDAFCDAEAFALMTSGYRLTQHELRTQLGFTDVIGRLTAAPMEPYPWRFLDIEPAMKHLSTDDRLARILRVGKSNSLKAAELVPWLKPLLVMMSLGLGVLAACLFDSKLPGPTLLDLRWLVQFASDIELANLMLGLAAAVGIVVLVRPVRTVLLFVTKLLLGLAAAITLPVVAAIQIHVMDRLFLRYGRVEPVTREARGRNEI